MKNQLDLVGSSRDSWNESGGSRTRGNVRGSTKRWCEAGETRISGSLERVRTGMSLEESGAATVRLEVIASGRVRSQITQPAERQWRN
jgi:hypothetical protein